MRFVFLPLALCALLLACAPAASVAKTAQPAQAAAFSSIASGTYDGSAGALGPYRLLLNIERTGRASAVLTQLRSGKVYSASGQFTPGGQGGDVSLNLYAGERAEGSLSGRLLISGQAASLRGTLSLPPLRAALQLERQASPQPLPRFLPDVPQEDAAPAPPLPSSARSVPVYVTPTPGPQPR